jgi:hypothetical protein
VVQVMDLDPSTYESHWLHGSDRLWLESNCAADLWIETLHALGLDPVLGLGFTLGGDFDGEQWQMFTYPAECLRRIYGIATDEMNAWRPLVEHVEAHISLGHLVLLDVDAYHLSDTEGLTYHCAHQKTSVMAQYLDRDRRRLGYFHNAGYYQTEGRDVEAVLGIDGSGDPARLPPFALIARLDHVHPADEVTVEEAVRLGHEHLEMRPVSNPVTRMHKRIEEDLSWLAKEGLDTFHRYAFGSLRQCGSNAELAASYVEWWERAQGRAPSGASHELRTVAESMKTLEFALARAVRGRDCRLDQLFERPETAWAEAFHRLTELSDES